MAKKLFYSIMFFLAFGATTLQAQEKKPVTWADAPKWSYIRTQFSSISDDGKWVYWVSGPAEGDATLTLKNTQNENSFDFPLGGALSQGSFSDNGKYFGFREAQKYSEIKAAQKSRKPTFTKLVIVSLADTSKTVFEKVRSFSFAPGNSEWVAITFANESTPSPAGGPGAAAGNRADAPKGSDLILYNIKDKKSFNMGNVSEFQFNKAGNLLAYIVDATNRMGNGILLRDMNTGQISILENDDARYQSLRWNKEGTAFTALKSVKNPKYTSDVYSVLGFSHINGDLTRKVAYNGIEDANFPEGKGISQHAVPYWSDDLGTLYFGIANLEKKKETKADSTKNNNRPAPGNSAANASNDERPDMIIWNWQDTRLQSEQQVAQNRDKNFSFISSYNPQTKQFIQITDSNMRSAQIGPKQKYGLGYDYTPYQMDNNLSGQNYVDLYIIDLKTGNKNLFIENYYQNASRSLAFSPDGNLLSFYQDGHYYVHNLNNNTRTTLTENIPSTFINLNSDHNIVKPATPFMGWSSDSRFVLIKDSHDLWKISADGKKAVSLSSNWKANNLGVNAPARIYPDDEGIDFKKPQYFSLFNTRNKQAGYALLEPGKDELKVLFLGDKRYGSFQKAKNASTFMYSIEDAATPPELVVTQNAQLNNTKQLTQNTKGLDEFGINSGVRLLQFVSAYGDTLEASLYLPANYKEGQSYPTITYIYERLTQDLNSYAQPAIPGGGFNRAMYTSNGYAVLMPDIKYKMNEPGNSAVAAVVPAVEAAIATGIVDRNRVGIHGHSWGGYQTSFLITQTNIFKAAVAGAALTNMISMYSLIYWNSGSTNQSIFESSQGRFTSGYWDNWDAYKRNSPIYYIKNVETPLLLLHNDKDGAVDYTQGIEYFNGLRRLNKPVAMLTYKGENHGLVKDVNKKDYAVRMMEYFDHYLKGAEAPDWWSKGINHLDLKDHLDSRAKSTK